MAFPTTGLLDDFVGAAAADPNWSKIGIASIQFLNYDGAGHGIDPSRAQFTWCYYNVASYGADSEAYATINARAADVIRIGGRITNEGTTTHQGYYVAISATDVWSIIRIVSGGAPTTLVTGPTQALAIGDQIGIEIAGTTINAWYKPSGGAWAQQTTVTDTTFAAAGRLALEFGLANTKLEDFNGGTRVAGITYTDAPAGTITLSGSTTDSKTTVDAEAGTVRLSGASADTRLTVDAVSGAVTLSGGALDTHTYADAPAGTIRLGGSSFDTYTPPGSGGGHSVIRATAAISRSPAAAAVAARVGAVAAVSSSRAAAAISPNV